MAIDSTDLKAFARGGKKPASDPDASWGAKTDNAVRGKTKTKRFYFGYKLHLLSDTKYELPLAANVTKASAHDVRIASRVLSNARYTHSKFLPDYVIADAGYCSSHLRHVIRRQYKAEPIIKAHPLHKKLIRPETEEFRQVYNRRSSVERVFSRLKGHRKLNSITVRRLRKVTVHCFLSLIVVQAHALHSYLSEEVASIRQCVMAVA